MRIANLVLLGLTMATVANALDLGTMGNDHLNQLQLAQAGKSSSKSSSKNSDPFGIGGFVAGCILIPFSIVLLWKNEKKIVTFAKCMDRAQKECQTVEPESVNSDMNFKLVHLNGKTVNETELEDLNFGITVENSYRLKRIVEVYQWHETATKKEGKDEWDYHHHKAWSSTKINSSNFKEPSGHENPDGWPVESETWTAQKVTLGDYQLSADQVRRLGSGRTEKIQPEQEQIDRTKDMMMQGGYAEFQCRGNYLISSNKDNSMTGEHVGQMRVSFENDKCGTTTVIAQQMQDNDEVFTFRKWNPDKTEVPYGESTDAEGDATCTNPCCCYICLCVNCLFNTLFEETVDYAADSQVTSGHFFDEQKKGVETAGKIFRPLGIVACIFGFWSLFSPIIAILKWIPLVGWLLGGLVSFAAFLFALIVGLTISCLVIAVAWVFFRPLIGVPLLVAVATSCYFIFLYDWGTPETVTDGGSTTDTVKTT